MSKPQVQLMAVSNVFSMMMRFVNKGDVERTHKHTYDHATLVAKGMVRYELLEEDGSVSYSKDFVAPNFVFVPKNKEHTLTSLSDDTVCYCIHALRTVDSDIVDPSFLISPINYNCDNINKKLQDFYKDDPDKKDLKIQDVACR